MDLRQLLPELDNPNSFLRLGLIVERHGEGAVRANVRHVRVHSPTGFECGYSGSGPADLALSVLHALVPPPAEDAEEAQYRLEVWTFDNIVGDDACWCDRVGPDCRRWQDARGRARRGGTHLKNAIAMRFYPCRNSLGDSAHGYCDGGRAGKA